MLTTTLIKKANRLLANKASQLLKHHRINHAYTFFLMELYECDSLTQSDLAVRIGIEQPTATRTLDRMERDGFITRVPSKTDRRSFVIRLTKKSKDCRPIIESCALQLNTLALAKISSSDKKKLDELLIMIINNIKHG